MNHFVEYFISADVSTINQLHFELRDEKDKLVELGVGAATYIRLKIKQTIVKGKWILLIFLVMTK